MTMMYTVGNESQDTGYNNEYYTICYGYDQ